jgi:glycosyltransferase involved in cell wall biosynthesis
VLQALTEGLGNAASVQFLGARADADAVLRDADVVWLPTLANGGRQVALEAMALGKPVIASDVPCLREILQDGETGFLVPPGNVLQLARRTRTLFNDAGLRERIGMAAQDHVERHFSLAEAVRRWRDFYGAVAA